MQRIFQSPRRTPCNRRSGRFRDGNAIVEFALVFMLLLTLLVAIFEFTWVLFLRATLHHAAREGVRAAITGDDQPSGLDPRIKAVIQKNTFGILDPADLDKHVTVQFFDAECPGASCPLTAAEPSSIVRVSIDCYALTPITSLIRKKDPSSGAPFPFSITVSASDKMEPFTGGPANRGTIATSTSCAP